MSLAVLYFLWGVVRYVIAKGAEDKEQARGVIIYGIVGLFVIFSVWGIIFLLQGVFGISPFSAAPPIPRIPGTF